MSTHREQVEALSRTIDSSHGMWGAGDLKDAVDAALRIRAPLGVPGSMDSLGHAYTAASGDVSQVQSEVQNIGHEKLPDAWTGQVGEKAAEVVGASADDLGRMSEVFGRAGSLLSELCDVLAKAQALYAHGSGPLIHASQLLADITGWGGVPDPVNWDDDKMHEAHSSAKDGIASMLDAAKHAEDAGHRTVSELNRLAAEAEAGRMKGGDLSAADRLVLADASDPGNVNQILTANEATRAGQFMDRLNAQDRTRMDSLLAGARSPQERAYLMKALAAGHSIDEVSQFDALIHLHGDDPAWLADHLVPALADTGDRSARHEVTYRGQQISIDGRPIYSQGGYNDCVAASTVIAQAKLDPLLMLQLTTGNTPEVPGADSPENFQQRLQSVYLQQYAQGQKADGQKIDPNGGGIGPKGETFLANQDLGKATGTTYEFTSLNSPDDRKAALSRIEKAVDEGLPVPLDVNNATEAHQMMITGRSGNMLEIYNPWGSTTWVTEDQFISSDLGSATGGQNINNPYSVELPK